MFRQTLSILWVFVELVALVRAGIATYRLVFTVTGDQVYTIFTLGVIEGVFLASLFLMRVEAVAPISALLALVFSAVAQYYELRLMAGVLTPSEQEVLTYIISFAPVVVLGLAYVRHLVGSGGENPLLDVVDKVRQLRQAQLPQQQAQAQASVGRGSKRVA